MEATLELVKKLIEGGVPKEVEKGKGLALVLLATQVGRVVSKLEEVITGLNSLAREIGTQKQEEKRF